MGADRKPALVTGAAGVVGSQIARRFLLEGMSVRALDQRPVDVAGVGSCVGDVTDPGAVQRATAGAALVVHCAAVISGTPEETMQVNAEGTRVLLEAAMQAGCERFLYMSTAAVYAFEGRAVVDESTPFLQEGPAFQLSRVRAEQAVWAARPPGQSGKRTTSLTDRRRGESMLTVSATGWLGLLAHPSGGRALARAPQRSEGRAGVGLHERLE